MAHLLEQISEMRPVFRVSDREATLEFYTTVLGLKLLSEENSALSFGGNGESDEEKQPRIICIVSPESLDFRPASPQKRHLLTILNYNQDEVKWLLSNNLDRVELISHNSNFGYSFTVTSPDGDTFAVQSGEDPGNIEIRKENITLEELSSNADAITDIEVVSTMLCSPSGTVFYPKRLSGAYIHAVPMPFEESEDTWDLESAQFILKPGITLYELLFDLEAVNYMIDSSTNTLTVKVPDGFELQFVEGNPDA